MSKNKNPMINANVKDVLKTVLVLLVIACVSGGLLGGINAVTYMSDDEILSTKISKVYSADSFINLAKEESKSDYEKEYNAVTAIRNDENKGQQTDVLLPVKNNAVEQGVVIYKVYGKGDYDCTLLVIVKDNLIDSVSVFSSSATPGIGDKAYKDNYIKQFKGKNMLESEPFVIIKNPSKNNEISAVAGATKSSVAVLNALNKVMLVHKTLYGGSSK